MNDWWAGFAATIVILAILLFAWATVHNEQQGNIRRDLERQRTEQVRIQACDGIEDKSLRVLCINGISDR